MPARYPSDAGSGPRRIVATSPRANKSLLTPLDLRGCVREGPLSDTNSETPHDLGWVSEMWFALALVDEHSRSWRDAADRLERRPHLVRYPPRRDIPRTGQQRVLSHDRLALGHGRVQLSSLGLADQPDEVGRRDTRRQNARLIPQPRQLRRMRLEHLAPGSIPQCLRVLGERMLSQLCAVCAHSAHTALANRSSDGLQTHSADRHLYPGVPSRSLLRARCCSCRSCTPGSQSLPYVADGPTRGSLRTSASRKACTYARSWSIRACT